MAGTRDLVIYPARTLYEQTFHQNVPTIKGKLECTIEIQMFALRKTVSVVLFYVDYVKLKTFLKAFGENVLMVSISPLLVLYRLLWFLVTLGHKQLYK